MTHPIRAFIAAATALMAMVLVPAATPASAQDVVKIGQIEAQTGANAIYGWMSSQGAALAVAEIAAGSPRPFLLGFSQGAGFALGVALLRPELAAGVLSLSGVARALDDRDHAPPRELRGFPVFAAHGLQDPLIPIELGRKLRDDLTQLGMDVDWHEYDMGHMVIPEEIADAKEWLKKHS